MYFKRFIFVLFLLSIIVLIVFLSLHKKQEPIIVKNTTKYNIPYQEKKLDLKKPLLSFEKETEKPLFEETDTKNNASSFKFISFSRCDSNIDKPDSLSKKINTQTKEDPPLNKNNILNKMDCGLIQTNFPLNF